VRIVYHSLRGQFSDSPRAVYERLVALGADVEHVWLTSPRWEPVFPDDVEKAGYGTPEGRAALESADVVVSNDHLDVDWDKPAGTLYLQTWHGTPLKRIHRDVMWAPEGRLDRLELDIARWDHMLSPNAVSTPRLRKAFGFDRPVHETGYPRNDVLNAPDRDARRAAVRRQLGIADGVTAVLYTPTWRDDSVFGEGVPDHSLALDVAEFARRLGSDHVLLLRLHSMVLDPLELPAGAPVVDVSGHPEVSDLYLAADLMVTDYSSTMFDFAVTGKPLLFFTYDLDHYRSTLRGFYFDLEDVAPGPMLATSDEVLTAIRDVDAVAAAHADRYARFQDTFTSLEDGHATDRVVDLFFSGSTPAAPESTTPEGGHEHAHH
jgi:CDP-glycerol glycerophosphotransferase (TagB/SpsB family)